MISNDKQLNLTLVGEVPSMKDLPYQEVAMCSTPLEAVKRCMGKVFMTEDDWAEYLGTTQSSLNQILNADKANKRPRHFPLAWVSQIQTRAGNRCISQYFDLESKGLLYRQQRQETELTVEEKAIQYDRLRAMSS